MSKPLKKSNSRLGVARLALPFTRLELPGWGRVYSQFGLDGAENDANWRGAPRREIRGKWHGYWMDLDLSNWSERHTYFLGRYYDLATQLLFRNLVDPGDHVIDVGANIGMLTLLAARLVTASGKVSAIEPNPLCADRIQRSLERNHISHVELHRVGLADFDGQATLSVVTNHPGMGTLAEVPAKDRGLVSASHTVPVKRADDLLADGPSPKLIKVDVEGFEFRVLKGMEETIRAAQPAVTLEVVDEHLRRDNVTRNDLFKWFEGLRYEGYALTTYRTRLRYQLKLVPLSAASSESFSDVLWLPNRSVLYPRLVP